MTYKLSDVSKIVGFYRRHQRIPQLYEVEEAWKAAQSGDMEGAVRFLDWRRHCFLAKSEEERQALARIMALCNELFEK